MVYHTSPTDCNSFAQTDFAIVKHSHFDWNVDFQRKIIKGSVTHTIIAVNDAGAQSLVLDTSNLEISKVLDENDGELKFDLGPKHDKFGSALTIKLNKLLSMGEECIVKIEYETNEKCSALQWLQPEQTVGLKNPYMFSQCQAIHARSLYPCQDTPGVKFTYTAQVTSSLENLKALMSAVRIDNNQNVFKFEQTVAIPSYLVAIAVGNLEGIKVGPRTTVWSEPEVVKQAAWEFEDTEDFLKIGEALLIPYEWKIYDLLVLPASFPYGILFNRRNGESLFNICNSHIISRRSIIS